MTMMIGMAVFGVAVLAGAGAAAGLLRHASASARHLVWTIALGVLLVAPVLELSGLRVEVPVPVAWMGEPEGTTQSRIDERSEPAGVGSPRSDGSLVEASLASGGAAARGTRAPVRTAAAQERASVAHVPAARSTSELLPAHESGRTFDPASSGLGAISIVGGVWALVALWLFAATAFGHVAAWRMSTEGVDPPDPRVGRRFATLCVEHGVRRPVRLRVSASIRVPAMWGFLRPTIVLPPQHARWSRATLDRVLLHELAHVQRGDCWTYLIGELARAVHWPNPLVWYAVARQRAESERASDDLVLTRGSAASEYAADLLAMVRSLQPGRPLPHAALAMARPSELTDRVRAVLDPAVERRGVGGGVALGTTTVALALCVLATILVPVARAQEAAEGSEPSVESQPAPETKIIALATEPVRSPSDEARPTPPELPKPDRRLEAFPQEVCAYTGQGRRSTQINSDDDEVHIRWETDECRVDVEIIGRVEFSGDDTRVESMEPGARLEIDQRLGDRQRRVRLESRGGSIERTFWVDRDEVGWGAEADRWLAQILPELFRQTTINAEARVRRMLREGGPARVFDEVALIHSDHVKQVYLELLMEAADLTEQEYARVIEAASEIDSDHTSSELLLSVIEAAGMKAAFQEPMLRAAGRIDSDHQKARVLQTLLASNLSSEQFDEVIVVASTIDSDHNLATVLETVAREGDLSRAGRASFLRAVRSIDSDHNRSQVIFAFLDVGTLSPDEITTVLEMTDGMDSDHNRAQVLQRIADEYQLSAAQLETYLWSADQLESDHQIQMVASAVVDAPSFGPDHLATVLSMAAGVDSDHNRAMILQALIQKHELDSRQVIALIDVARGLGSDHQLGLVLRLVAEDERLDAVGVGAIVESCSGIGSSHDRSSVLIAVAGRHDVEGAARQRYLELADGLSRHDRDRALAALGETRRR